MTRSRIMKIVLTALAAAVTILIAVCYQAVLERLGIVRAVADQVAPEHGPSPLVALVSSPFFFLPGIAVVFTAIGVWINEAFRAWDQRRAHHKWWEGLHSFSIQAFACLVARIPENDFEKSSRAKAVANEIRGYVNSGHMPLLLELPTPTTPVYGPIYATKTIGNDAVVLKEQLEKLALARGWRLPWQILPPKPPPASPLSPEPVLGSNLMRLAQLGNQNDKQ